MYDELKNRSLSKKIEDLKLGLSKKTYSIDQLSKVRKQIYQLVRMPYLKLSNYEFYLITGTYYVISILMSAIFGSCLLDEDKGKNLASVVEISSAIIQPVIMFTCPGYFYYLACKHEQISYKNNLNQKFALAFSIMGLILAFIYSSIATYWAFQ
eukprot:403334186